MGRKGVGLFTWHGVAAREPGRAHPYEIRISAQLRSRLECLYRLPPTALLLLVFACGFLALEREEKQKKDDK